MKRVAIALAAVVVALAAPAGAQVAPSPQAVPPASSPPPPGYTPAPGYNTNYGYGTGYPPYGYQGSDTQRRSGTEIGLLYATAAAYGVGLGVWLGAEIGIDDPALFLIPPAILGIAAPAGVYVADHPPMRRGLPAAIAAGAVIGAGEGIGIASLQFVTATEEDAWGFRGLSRATAIGATVGALGGAALGTLQRPSPKSSLLMTSSVVWGSAVGAMFGYGTTEKDIGYGRANDAAARGGLIGYNVGLVASAALSTIYIPSYRSIAWMWTGAGIGFAASLPVYLLYAGSDSPAKRGLVFSATATTLGIGAGALFSAGTRDSASSGAPSFARVTGVGPLAAGSMLGLAVDGEWL